MEKLSVPNVKAIIEKEVDGERWIILQTRNKPEKDPYTQRYEIPGGKLRAYEKIKAALEREIKEECGLDLEYVLNTDSRKTKEGKDCVETIKPFTVYQMIEGPYPSMGLVFICHTKGQLLQNGDETKNPFWVELNRLRYLIQKTPEAFTLLDRAILLEYLS